MIVWLASYPRSGNTLLRQLLKQVFHQETYSFSNDVKDLGSDQVAAKIVGHLIYESSWDEFFSQSSLSTKPVFIKTHQPPCDQSKVIYIVRDGRAAIVSYYHLLHDYRRRTDIDIPKVIRGETPLGSWSEHLEHWQPLTRTECLLLRFEDLIEKPAECIKKITLFTRLTPESNWQNPLEKLRDEMPGFFRRGSNQENIKELNEIDEVHFWELHRPWMTKLGYGQHE